MEINIIEDDVIGNIDREFREQYPYLKLQFYKRPHAEGESSLGKDRLDAGLPIEEATMFHSAGRINIAPERTVAEVECDFFHMLGLCVQVMRLSGQVWLETSDTDRWTLQEQNDKGLEYSKPLSPDSPLDFDLQDVD